MSHFRKLLGTVLILSLLIPLVCQAGDHVPVVVAVNPSVMAAVMSRSEIRAIFAMRRSTWRDGTPVRVFVLPDDDPVHRDFCKKILKIYPHQLRRIWDRNIFSGIGQTPIEVETLGEMRERISQTSGAIGYLTEDHADASVRKVEVP